MNLRYLRKSTVSILNIGGPGPAKTEQATNTRRYCICGRKANSLTYFLPLAELFDFCYRKSALTRRALLLCCRFRAFAIGENSLGSIKGVCGNKWC